MATRQEPWWPQHTTIISGQPLRIFRSPSPASRTGHVDLIFCHGWGEDPRAYRHFLQHLQGSGWTVAAPAFPGYGGSGTFRRPLLAPVERGARRVTRALAQVPLPSPAWVIAHSMGAASAVRFAEQHPQRVAGLVLLCPIGQPSNRVRDWWRAATDLRTPSPRSARSRLRALLPALVSGPVGFAATGIDCKRHDLRLRLEGLALQGVPVLVLRAANDKVVRTDQLHLIPGVRVRDVSGTHNLPLEEPQRCAHLVEAMIAHHRQETVSAAAPIKSP